MIRAVVFDAVGTVIYPSCPVAKVYQAALARHCELQLSEKQIAEVIRQSLDGRSHGESLQTNEVAEREFWRQLIYGMCGDHDAVEACFDDLHAKFGDPSNWACFDDVADCMRSLHEQRLTIAIGSNFDLRLHSVLDGLSPLSDVKHRFISSEIGFRKPAEQFFEAVVGELLLEPRQVLFVGDDPRNDVFGANRVGCHTAWICRRSNPPEDIPAWTAWISSLRQVSELVMSLKEESS